MPRRLNLGWNLTDVRVSMVTVKVFGNLRKIVGASECRIDIGGNYNTIGHLLFSFARQYGKQLKHELFDSEGEIRPTYSVLVNGGNITSFLGLETKLKEDDVVAILPVVEGG